jgi:hypothetical protein
MDWKEIDNGVLVSSAGIVIHKSGKKMKSDYCFGYRGVQPNPGKSKRFRVHRLVAEAFIPNPENKPYINHKNFNRADNRVQNLEWCTAKENSQHTSMHKRFNTPKGENSVHAKLSAEQVNKIRNTFKSGCRTNGQRALGKRFGVSKSAIGLIINNKNWKNEHSHRG